MSESDIASNSEKGRRLPSDNDCFSETFISLMDERFRSHVAVDAVAYAQVTSAQRQGERRSYRDGNTQ